MRENENRSSMKQQESRADEGEHTRDVTSIRSSSDINSSDSGHRFRPLQGTIIFFTLVAGMAVQIACLVKRLTALLKHASLMTETHHEHVRQRRGSTNPY